MLQSDTDVAERIMAVQIADNSDRTASDSPSDAHVNSPANPRQELTEEPQSENDASRNHPVEPTWISEMRDSFMARICDEDTIETIWKMLKYKWYEFFIPKMVSKCLTALTCENYRTPQMNHKEL